MSKVVRVSVNQSLFDIAIEKGGSIETAFGLAVINNISVTDDLIPGMGLMPPNTKFKQIVEYFTTHNLKPGTAGTVDINSDSIFSEEFPIEFP